MVSQATKEYLQRMYERDMSDSEKIISLLVQILDLMRELLDSNLRGLENQDFARKQSEANQVEGFRITPIFKEK